MSTIVFATACAADGAVDEPLSPGAEAPADSPGMDDPATTGPTFEIRLTDAPGDFDEVWVDISAVEIFSESEGWITLADSPQSFDLLTLQDDVTAALGAADLEPGHYGQLRFKVGNAFVVSGGVSEDLKIASGAQTGIKMNLDADVEAQTAYALTIDFDAGKSVKQTGQGWLMTPVVSVKDFTGTPIPPQADDDGSAEDPDGGASDDTGDDAGGDTGDDSGTGGDAGTDPQP